MVYERRELTPYELVLEYDREHARLQEEVRQLRAEVVALDKKTAQSGDATLHDEIARLRLELMAARDQAVGALAERDAALARRADESRQVAERTRARTQAEIEAEIHRSGVAAGQPDAPGDPTGRPGEAPVAALRRTAVSTPRFSIPLRCTTRRWTCCATAQTGLAQTTRDWQWCVVDDGSRDPSVRTLLAELAANPRVTLTVRERSGGIVAASNDGVVAAVGEFLVLLDHDDTLHPDALARIDALADGGVDLVYTDENVLAANGKVLDPIRKPGWSPERLRAHHYVNHMIAVRTSLLRELGCFRAGLDGSQDHDLVLRVSERARAILHLPAVLYRWRTAPDSVLERGLAAKPGAWGRPRRGGRALRPDGHRRRRRRAGGTWHRPVVPGAPAGARRGFVAVVVPVVAADLAAYPADRVPGPAPDPSSGEERPGGPCRQSRRPTRWPPRCWWSAPTTSRASRWRPPPRPAGKVAAQAGGV